MARLLRIEEVTDRTGLARSTIYRRERRGEFPRRVKLGGNAVAWREDEIDDWINSRPRGMGTCAAADG